MKFLLDMPVSHLLLDVLQLTDMKVFTPIKSERIVPRTANCSI